MDNKSNVVKQAMILAAGEGTRMRPITNLIPKPMVEVDGKTIIERIIDNLISYGIERIVISTCFKADILENYIKSKYKDLKDVEIIFSREEELMNSGGGVDKALKDGKLKPNNFIIINSDMIYSKFSEQLDNLINIHCNNNSKITMLLQEPRLSFGIEDKPTYFLNKKTHELTKITSANLKGKFCYVGLSIFNPSIFTTYQKTVEKFSLSEFFIQASKNNELYGFESTERVYQIDKPHKIEECSKLLREDKQNNNDCITL